MILNLILNIFLYRCTGRFYEKYPKKIAFVSIILSQFSIPQLIHVYKIFVTMTTRLIQDDLKPITAFLMKLTFDLSPVSDEIDQTVCNPTSQLHRHNLSFLYRIM